MSHNNQIKHVIEGFDDDFDSISQDFVKRKPEMRLTDFLEYWNELSLDSIFANRFDPRELLESIQEMYKVLTRIITNSSNQDKTKKLIALYFLLCLAVKQPDRLRQKIRLTCEDSILIQNLFLNPSDDDNHGDADFVWKLLRVKNMVEFVEERNIYGPSMLLSSSARKGEVDQQTEDNEETLNFIENKIVPAIRDLDSICEPYEQMKALLKLDEYNDPTVEMKSTSTIRDSLNQANSLLSSFRTDDT